MPTTVSPAALEHLKHFEQGPHGGFAAEPYRCPAGQLTVGWGHVVLPNDRFTYPLSEERAETLLQHDLEGCVQQVNLWVIVPLTQGMLDALACFIFNIGVASFSGSTLLYLLNQRNYAAAAEEFPRWNRARDPRSGKKVPLPGLTRRRLAERELFLKDGGVM